MAEATRASAEAQRLADQASAQEEKARALADKEVAQNRSARLLRGLMIGALLAAGVFAGLSYFLYQENQRATVSETRAQKSEQDAATFQKQNEAIRAEREELASKAEAANSALRIANARADQIKVQADRDRDVLTEALKRASEGERFKHEIQLKDAERLTAEARRQLSERQFKDAIENMLAVLPDKEGERDRPYYAPAEAVLYDALQALPHPRTTLIRDSSRSSREVAFSSDGKLAMAVSFTYDIRGAKIHVLDMELEKPVAALDGDHAAISPNGKLIAVAKATAIKIYDAVTLAELAGVATAETVEFMTFSPDGTRVGVAYGGDYADIIDARTAQVAAKLQQPQGLRIHKLAFSPDSARVLTISNFLYTARIFDAKTGRELAKLVGHSGSSPYGLVKAGAFSPDGKRVVTGAADTALMWSVQGERVGEFPVSNVTHVAFSPLKGDRLLTAWDDIKVRLWDTSTAKPLRDLSFPSGSIRALQYSADGSRVLAAGGSGTAYVCDRDLSLLASLSSGKETMLSAALSPDGKRVLTGTQEGAVQLWDVETRAEIAQLRVGPGAQKVAFSADGRSLVVTSGDSSKTLELPAGVQPPSAAMVATPTGGGRSVEATGEGTIAVVEPIDGKKITAAHLTPSVACVLESPVLSSDGTRAAAICGEAVHVWRVYPSTQDIVAAAKSVLAGL